MKVPTRKCIVCHKRLPKMELARHVIDDSTGKLEPDLRQIAQKRGYYTCTDAACITMLDKAFAKIKGKKRR